ncbi:hypothetical protein ACGFH8_18380 [Micromonospora sp. NPDC049175]|uniref:hypothetical protein n=1 Tax=Micromonospora sp. NPDC049175 TaxID=3364266 RepID=UPI00371CC13E
MNKPYTYLFVGYASDRAAVRYLNSLHGLVETMRHDHPGRVEARVELATGPEHLRDLLSTESDLLVYGGHAGVEEGSPYLGGGDESLYLDHLPDPQGTTIKAAGIVFDCCESGTEDFIAAVGRRVDAPAAYLGCNGTAPYTHGPVLLPVLLAQLACPKEPATPSCTTYRRAMEQTLLVAKTVWRADWERWVITDLTPPASHGTPLQQRSPAGPTGTAALSGG